MTYFIKTQFGKWTFAIKVLWYKLDVSLKILAGFHFVNHFWNVAIKQNAKWHYNVGQVSLKVHFQDSFPLCEMVWGLSLKTSYISFLMMTVLLWPVWRNNVSYHKTMYVLQNKPLKNKFTFIFVQNSHVSSFNIHPSTTTSATYLSSNFCSSHKCVPVI